MSGHIRRRGERSWEIKFDLGIDPLSGKRDTRYVSIKGTKRDAQAKLTELLSEAARGVLVDPSKETLGAFMDRWDRDWAAHNVSPKTAERYRQLITNQIKPHLGAMPVQKIKAVHLNELYTKLLQTGGIDGGTLAAQTVGHVHRLLRRALGHAAQWGVTAQNPASLVHPPRVAQTEIEIIREDEIRAVLSVLRGRNAPLYTIATVALATGMRRGVHALRHTHASSLIAAGIDVLTISRRLGHANPKITLSVYGHLYGNTDDKAAQAVEAMFARIGTE